jgi:hypothetical protein
LDGGIKLLGVGSMTEHWAAQYWMITQPFDFAQAGAEANNSSAFAPGK